jgi:hypothetical protein
MLKQRTVRSEKEFNLFFGHTLVYAGSCKYMIKQLIHCHLDMVSFVSALSIVFSFLYVCLKYMDDKL